MAFSFELITYCSYMCVYGAWSDGNIEVDLARNRAPPIAHPQPKLHVRIWSSTNWGPHWLKKPGRIPGHLYGKGGGGKEESGDQSWRGLIGRRKGQKIGEKKERFVNF